MNSPSRTYEQLELLPVGSVSTHPPLKVAQRLKMVMEQLLRFFAPSDGQPRINIRYSLNGEVLFDVYDSVTQQRQRYRSEEALRIWLEQRYNANARQDSH